MTVLAVKHYGNRIEIATDSGGFLGSSGVKNENTQKLYEVNDIIYCASGIAGESNLFELYCSTQKPEGNRKLDIVRFFANFSKWMRSEFNKTPDVRDVLYNNYFFFYEKKLFHVWGNLDCYEIEEGKFASNGTGLVEANVAMFLGQSPRQAIETTIRFNYWTAGAVQEKIIHLTKIKK